MHTFASCVDVCSPAGASLVKGSMYSFFFIPLVYHKIVLQKRFFYLTRGGGQDDILEGKYLHRTLMALSATLECGAKRKQLKLFFYFVKNILSLFC